MAKAKELGNRVDFEKVRKKRQRIQSIKRLIALGIVIACVFAIFIVNRYMVDTGVTIRISDFVESVGGTGYPIAVPGGIVRDVKSSGSDLVVLNDTNLYVYNKKGKTINNLQRMNESTVAVVRNNRILTFEVMNRNYAVHSKTKTLHESSSEYVLLGGDINNQGDYALITTSEQSAARVVVYNQKNEEMAEILREHLVTNISISPKGNRMAAVGVNTVGGEVYTLLWLFDLSVGRELVMLELHGEMPYDVQYLDDGKFSVLTDQKYRVYSSEGVQEGAYDFMGYELQAVERSGKNALVLLQSWDHGSYNLVLLGSGCAIQSEVSLEDRVRDIALGGNRIYVLKDTGITTYSMAFEEKGVLELRGITEIHAIKDTLYYFGREEIQILGSAGTGSNT